MPYCNFDLYFSITNNVISLFVPVGHLYVFLEKCLFRSSLLIFLLDCLLFYTELYELFEYFRNSVLIGSIICKFFLLFCRLFSHLVVGFLC